ncbi:hypothetical protein [Maioricimonas sp. JC845]|uniref:hypothetical protein n=1 Tax=Maioricimonas sp. JC845 TaxID=3232138 RepID=UPI00345752B7
MMHHVRTISLWAVAAAVCLIGDAVGLADDPAGNGAESGRERPPVQAPAGPIEELPGRVLQGMHSAGERMARGRFDPETVALQRQLIADLDLLMAAMEQSPPPESPPSPQPSPSQESGQEQTQQEEQQAGSEPQTGSGAAAGDPGQRSDQPATGSEERTGPGQVSEAERRRRRELADAVWGHLPPRVQEEMRRSFSERYLPEYEAMIRSYYETLAEQARGE